MSGVGEGHIKFQGTIIKLMSDFSTEMTEARGDSIITFLNAEGEAVVLELCFQQKYLSGVKGQ